MFPVGLLVFFSLSQVIISVPSPGRVNVCSRQVSVLSSRAVSNSVSYQLRGYTGCGLFDWSRCTKYSRRYNLAYQLEYYATYSTNYYCCDGWAEDGFGGCSICVWDCGIGGTCDSPNTCDCFSGFEGTRCDDIDECDDNNGGCPNLCINTEGSYYCQCYMGYDEVDGQCKAVCQPPCVHGECTSPGHCECEGNYVGDDCSDLNECRSENGGCDHICENFNGGFECKCFSGYTLSMLTECLPVCVPPCENNGHCSGPGQCNCPDTYTGDRCEDDVDECLVDNGGCDHTCENLPGRFSCSCQDGYTGTSDCIDINECTFANCHSCINSPGSFECICKSGYEVANLYNCEDVDECVAGIAECTQHCSNTIGNFSCDCDEGWTLNLDGKTCTANQCVHIGIPFNGTRDCTGFTTGESCIFECGWNYRIVGSHRRECLPSGVWDGQITQCEEILCPEILSPTNGYTSYPCYNNVGSRCTFGCDFGYFLEGDPVTECQLSGLWSSPVLACIEINFCTPPPCLKGVCHLSQIEADGYFCDCSGTGYTGTHCEYGFVRTPDWPSIWVGNVYEDLEFYAKPNETLIVTIMTDPSKVVVEPSKLYFTPKSNTQTVSIQGRVQGPTQIQYVLRGKGAAKFISPDADELFVFLNNTIDDGYVYGRYLSPGNQLPLGCFELSDLSICSDLQFISTEKWDDINAAVETNGIVAVTTDTFELPLNLNGYSTTNTYNIKATYPANCQSKDITLNDVQDFVQLNSLYRTYTRQLERILPDWITFISTNIDPEKSKASLSSLILSGKKLKSIKWCSSAPVINDGQYSVYLLYKTELIIGGRHVSLPLPPYKGKYCFIVGVCNITSGTFMMMFPEGSRDLLSYINDRDFDDSIDVEVSSLAFSTSNMLNPNGQYCQDDDKISIFANLQYTYIINQTVYARLEGSGDVHVNLDETTQLFTRLFTQLWQIQQHGKSKIRLQWRILGEDVSLEFGSKQVQNSILNASIGDVYKRQTSYGVFDGTPFSWLLNHKGEGTSVQVFIDYDLTPSISIPTELSYVTQIVSQLQNFTSELMTFAEELMSFGYDNMHSAIRSSASYLDDTIKNYFNVLYKNQIKPIANSLSKLRIQCKENLNELRYINETLFSISKSQHNYFKNDLFNLIQRQEHLSNQVLIEVQTVFVEEIASVSGFRMRSGVCLSSYLCFPSLDLKVFYSLSNTSHHEYTELQTVESSMPKVYMRGTYDTKEKLNRFISIPIDAKLSIMLQSNKNIWIGSIPVFTNLLGIKQATTMQLTMSGIHFVLSGKLWALFDVEINVTSGLNSFKSMVLHADGDISVEGPFSLARIIKDKIITLTQKAVHDSERRVKQGIKSIEIAKSRLNLVLEEELLKKADVDNAQQKVISAKDDLLVANNNVDNAQESLDELSEYTAEVKDKLKDVCEVLECMGKCLPGTKIVTVTEDVYAYVPYKCCDNRTELALVEETTNCCWACQIPTPVKSFSFSVDIIKLAKAAVSAFSGDWWKAGEQLVSSVKVKRGQRLAYSKGECCEVCKKPVEIEVKYMSCSTCVDYQIVGKVENIGTEEIECSTQIPDSSCVSHNEDCRETRSYLFESLKITTPGLVDPIEALDNAVLHASIAEAVLNEALIELDDAVSQHEEVSARVQTLQAYLDIMQSAQIQISEDVQAGLAIKELQINGSIEASLEFKKLKFDIDLVGEDTTVIPVLCYLTLESIPVQIQIFIDFNNLNFTIENAALFITEELFGDITRSVRRRREASSRRHRPFHDRIRRDTTIIEQPPIDTVDYIVINKTLGHNINSIISRDLNVVQNDARCEDFNNILNFVKLSFQTLLEIANFSKVNNVQTLENVDDILNAYIYNLSSPLPEVVSDSVALEYFNLTVNDLKDINKSSGYRLEKNALTKVIYSAMVKANNTKSLLEADDVLSRWEDTMETYTRNYSGLTDCEGFNDCLTTELIGLKYLAEGRQIYQNVIDFDEYVSTILDKDTFSVKEAETSARHVLNEVIFLSRNNDICLKEPIITKHPESNIVTLEGNDVTIMCQASGIPSPTFSWMFNGHTLSGEHLNSLFLTKVDASHSGTYICLAKNTVTSVQSMQCDVTVEFAPLITEHPQDIDIEHGHPEGIFLTCKGTALPLPNYQWYFQSASSMTMKAILGQNASGLEILSPEYSQDGWYTCKVSNIHGSHMSNPARLNVLEVSVPEFSSDITITLFRLDDYNSTYINISLEDVISQVIKDDEPELERLNYKESNPTGMAFLTEITFDIISTNATSIDFMNASRHELAYQVQQKIEQVRVKVAKLNDLLTPGRIFEHRGELLEVTLFNAGFNGPICPITQYAHQNGYICVNCPPGSYRGNNKLPATCQQCPWGFYQPDEGQTECIVCDGDIVTDSGARLCPPKDDVLPSDTVTTVLNGTSTLLFHEPETNQLDGKVFIYAIGGGSGGLAVLVVVIVIIVCHQRKKKEKR
ncbi:uncharacterized protein LOC117100842 [Anneissia japonica]|uniref:uncharacterized protein LOC117100842 n=1 Tax=Anneissia japonica TaxID=1529436 RepID=UPI001425BB83|nr:uncharacterized protein LOC117100842 [Anneissia japonica]